MRDPGADGSASSAASMAAHRSPIWWTRRRPQSGSWSKLRVRRRLEVIGDFVSVIATSGQVRSTGLRVTDPKPASASPFTKGPCPPTGQAPAKLSRQMGRRSFRVSSPAANRAGSSHVCFDSLDQPIHVPMKIWIGSNRERIAIRQSLQRGREILLRWDHRPLHEHGNERDVAP